MAKEMEQDLLPIFMKHVVAVSLLDAKKDLDEDNQPEHFLFSSFVVSVQNIWFLITAGHILKQIETRIESGRRIVKTRIIDNFQNDQSKMSIPFDFEDAPKTYIVREDGIDYGAIVLRPCYVKLLLAGGIRALEQKECKDFPEKADKYFLIGFPSQAREIDQTSNANGGKICVNIGCPLISIEPILNPPAELQLQEKRFYAKVPVEGNQTSEDGRMTDIEGMSGGPIIAVKKIDSDVIEYRIIAVQSGWMKRQRILAACYIEPFISALRGTLIDRGHLTP